jgi:hypothetical protein
MNVALRTVRAILDHLSEHRELYRLASSWRSGAITPVPAVEADRAHRRDPFSVLPVWMWRPPA